MAIAFAQASARTQKVGDDNGPAVDFAVATVKPSAPSGGKLGYISYPSGRVEIDAESLITLLAYAFDVQEYQIKGGPDWAREDRYDLTAQPDIATGSPAKHSANAYRPTHPQQLALQKLIVERFALKFHIEKREGPVYILTRGSGPLRLQPARDREGLQGAAFTRSSENMLSGGAIGSNATMAILATVIGGDLDRPVIDQTGLTDYYDFRLPPFDSGDTDATQAIFKDMERLGLKLKAGKGPVETVVIESAERPTPN